MDSGAQEAREDPGLKVGFNSETSRRGARPGQASMST